MEYTSTITKDDAIFFIDMVKSVIYKPKPYLKILSDNNSNELRRFIEIYLTMRPILLEREMIILDELYGVNKDRAHLKDVAQLLNISPERVRQIRNEAEHKITSKLSKHTLK